MNTNDSCASRNRTSAPFGAVIGMSDYSTNGGYGHQPIPTPPPPPGDSK